MLLTLQMRRALAICQSPYFPEPVSSCKSASSLARTTRKEAPQRMTGSSPFLAAFLMDFKLTPISSAASASDMVSAGCFWELSSSFGAIAAILGHGSPAAQSQEVAEMG